MSVRVQDLVASRFDELRYEPTAKRLRAQLAVDTVVDSSRALLVWEPRRVVPTYAVPEEDITAELVIADPTADTAAPAGFAVPDVTNLRVFDPRIPFHVHSTAGQPVDIRAGGRTVQGFRPRDPDLAGYLILDFAGFDRWLEEDEEVIGHPHDPFKRIDVRRSSRHLRVVLDGEVLADTAQPMLLFETLLPVRYYIPREDVVAQVEPSPTTSVCAYKGQASYCSVRAGGRMVEDLAWYYEDPLLDALPVKGYLAFFNEKVDLELDGVPLPRPVTPWS